MASLTNNMNEDDNNNNNNNTVGDDVEMANNKQQDEIEIPESWKRMVFVSMGLAPMTILPFILVVEFGTEYFMDWKAFGLGALGWYVALMARIPFILLLDKGLSVEKEKAAPLIVSLSGPLEEGCRIALIAILGVDSSFSTYFSVGVGWASIEVVLAILNMFVVIQLMQRTDEKAVEAMEAMKKITGDRDIFETSPLWGVMERLSANMIHIGFTLFLSISLYLGIGLAIAHSCINLSIVYLAPKIGLPVVEIVFLVVATVVFAVSCLTFQF